MIEVEALTKRYGARTAVDAVSFSVPSGRVTGLLGPNGAGKSTTMRMILGLVRPSSGVAHLDGRALAAHPDPIPVVGGVFAGGAATHPGHSGRDHLRAIAATHGIGRVRVEEALEQ